MELELKKIIDATETLVAQDYLNEVVLNISSVINMEYVFIARTNLENDISSTTTVAKNGILSENFEYSLKDTPCENIANDSICSYEDNVSKTFSKDKLLIDMGIKGYVGSPLYDSNNNVIGIFVALSEKPIDNSDFILTIMQIFSGRIAAELDRMDKELELQSLNETLEDRIKLATIDLQKAQSLAKIGSWRYEIDKDILVWSDETYNIFQIDKIKHPIRTLENFTSIVDSVYIEVAMEAYNKHLKDGIPYDLTHELTLKDGTSKWIKERCETIYDDNGKPIESNGILQDVTEEIQRNQLLVQQSRMAQMGEMISMIAHQWRQPLGAIASTVIDMKIQSLMQNYDLENIDEVKQYELYINNGLDNIEMFVANLSTTIDDFRTFYKPNKKSSSVYFIEPINKALSMIKGSIISDGIEIVQTCTTCNSKVKIHSNELMQVILNILKNSQDNFKEKDIKQPKITIACKCSSDDKITLEIYDNGGGIAEDILPMIFDPYFSTKSEKNGTGLGLYMSKMIIEEHHNGRLLVNNRDDGVHFAIELRKDKIAQNL